MKAARDDWRAGSVYVALAVLGEAFLLMGFVFMALATPNGSLLIRDAVAALPGSPWRDASLTLLILGFGLKIGLVPGHVWMPLAYTAAPDSRSRGAERRGGQGWSDRADPLSAVRSPDAGVG